MISISLGEEGGGGACLVVCSGSEWFLQCNEL